jgi:hypothetical protein
MSYPKRERAELVNYEAVAEYLRVLFGTHWWKDDHFVNVRGIGEKGTDREGTFQEDQFAQPALAHDADDFLASTIVEWCRVWAQYNVASYIVPAVLKEARGRSEAVELFTAAVVDLDTGDTVAKGGYLVQHLGRPSMTVYSGGVTEAGTPKMHLYWCFDEPTADIGALVDLRHEIARKVGGDLQFGRGTPENPYGRAHQPIRIPGSVHAKADTPRAVTLAASNEIRYDFAMLQGAVARMPSSPWEIAASNAPAALAFDFGPTKNQRPDIAVALTSQIHEGGDDDRNRHTEFTRVAGHKIRLIRDGHITVDEAHEQLHGWVLDNMKPPWPSARVDKEFRGLLAHDESKRGPLPVAAVDESRTASIVRGDGSLGLREWAVPRWTHGEPPKRKFLVEGLVMGNKPGLLVAEGGCGKTFLMLSLSMQLALGEWAPEIVDGVASDSPFRGERLDGASWLGGRLCAAPGTVVMLTTEDDADELHIRMSTIDKNDRRFAAGDRLIIVPAVNTPRGPFAFGESCRPVAGASSCSSWPTCRTCGW